MSHSAPLTDAQLDIWFRRMAPVMDANCQRALAQIEELDMHNASDTRAKALDAAREDFRCIGENPEVAVVLARAAAYAAFIETGASATGRRSSSAAPARKSPGRARRRGSKSTKGSRA